MFACLGELSPLLSLGLGFANTQVKDTSNLTTDIPSYEILAQSYISTSIPEIFLRPGLRMAYEPSSHNERPRSLVINEKTLKTGLELGILWNSLLIPTLTAQAAIASRALSLQTRNPVVNSSTDKISHTEYLWQIAGSVSLGLPILEGRMIIEPFFRFLKVQDDYRQSSQWGIDVSYAFAILPVLQIGEPSP